MDDKVFDGLNLNEFCQQQHKDVLDKGFDNFHIPTILMLIVSELSEALEADRKNKHAQLGKFRYHYEYIFNTGDNLDGRFKVAFEQHVKDTFEDEIADAFLRLMDLCGAYGIDIERHIQLKAKYNKLRPPKHGKAY